MVHRARYEVSATSVAEARRFVADALEGAGLSALNDVVQLVVSELATNAVRHARTSFEVDLDLGDEVVVGVTDDGPGQPMEHHVTAGARSGRGLAIVASVSGAWGVQPCPQGKRVWCVLPRRPAGVDRRGGGVGSER